MQRRLLRVLNRIRRFFDAGNLVRAIVALILAFSLWAWVTAEQDPEITRTIPSVQVTAEHVAKNMQVVGDLPHVEIRLEGPQSKIQTLETGQIRAFVDMSSVKQPGKVALDVQVDAPSRIRVKSVTPDKVDIQVDQIASVQGVKIETTQPSDLPSNFVVKSMTTSPDHVTVSGPQENVSSVTAARVDVSVSGRTTSYSELVTPVPVDKNGNPVPNVTIEPAQVTLNVDLQVSGQVRRVIPEVTGTDALAPGYELVRPPTVVPSDQVIIDGPPDQIAKVLYLTTEPIDITGWSESKDLADVKIDTAKLPDGVTVSIQIRKQTFQQQVDSIPIKVVNSRAGTTATLSPTTATVTLEGSQPVVQGLTQNDISVVVDLNGAGPGNYQLQPKVILPAGVQYRQVDPPVVSVTVSEATPSSTTVPSPTPTPTQSP
jgi:YbbR domain-containing protein